MGKNKKRKNKKSTDKNLNNSNVMTEEEYEEYLMNLYGMSFIAGYTSGGMPYGTFIDEKNYAPEEEDIPF